MILIPVNDDKKTIAHRFRKAHSFAFLNEDEILLQENKHKTSQSPIFFEYFKTLHVDTLYIKELGYKTLVKLLDMDVKVFLVQEADTVNQIQENSLLKLTKENAKEHCSLGHHNKESN